MKFVYVVSIVLLAVLAVSGCQKKTPDEGAQSSGAESKEAAKSADDSKLLHPNWLG